MSRKIFYIGLALIMVLLLVTGCGDEAPVSEEPAEAVEDPGDEESATANGEEEYVFLAYVTALEFWDDPKQGFMDACDHLGVTGTFAGPVEFDPAAQARTMEELIARKPAGIVLWPADPDALVDPSRRAMEAGIHVINANSDVSDFDVRYGYVGINNLEAGKIGGQHAAELIGGSGKVGIVTVPGVTVHEDRKDGYLAVFDEYPDIEVVGIVNSEADPSVGIRVAAGLISANPDIDLLVGTSAPDGASIGRAIIEAGMVGDIKAVGMDRDADLLQFVKDGVVDATLVQRNYLENWIAVHYLYWLKHDLVEMVPDWQAAGVPPVAPNTDTGVMVVTADNVDFFIR